MIANGSTNRATFVASFRIGDFPCAGLKSFPWKTADCDSILVNAFDFLANPRTKRHASNLLATNQPLSEVFQFQSPIHLDSGAYNFLNAEDIPISPESIVELAVKLRVDTFVALDHPFLPDSTQEVRLKRQFTTVDNTRRMEEHRSVIGLAAPLVPVLHGHDFDAIEKSYRQALDAIESPVCTFGVGSLAPLAKTGSIRKVVEVVRWVRSLIGDARLHVFSVGSPLLMHFAFLAGADSVDSQSWMISAAFKQAQLPGLPQLRLSYQEAEKDPDGYARRRARFAEQLVFLCTQEDFQVRDWLTGSRTSVRDVQDAQTYIDGLEDRCGENRVHWRACHNLQVATSEARRLREFNCPVKASDFLLNRQAATPYRLAMEESVKDGVYV